MTSIAARNWQNLRKSRAWAGTVRFLQWWRDELLSGLPPKWKDLLHHQPERLMARRDGDEVVLWRDRNGGDELGRFHVSDAPDTCRQAVMAAMGQIEEENPQAVYLIDPGYVLRKTLTLPAAAEENLRQVLAFEMDRHTPFKADQVRYDCRVLSRREEQRSLKVELLVVLREQVDEVVELASERGLVLDAVDVLEADGHEGIGVNLLPPEQRRKRQRRQLRVNLLLLAGFIALLYVVMWQSLVVREQAIEDLRERKSEVQREAQNVTALRNELSEAREAARFLSDRKAQHPVVIDVLREVTRLLPQDTWLQRLQLNENRVTLTGQSPEAASLIRILQESELLTAPTPKGAYTPDPRSGKERFTIEATIRTPFEDMEEDDASVAAR